jgi:uncharacterized membrane protein YccF (DUF307 family)
MLGRILRAEELTLVLLGAAGGVAWGVLSLLFGMSLHLTHMPAVVRVSVTVVGLPLYLAGWLASSLQLPFVDPTGPVVATAAALGMLAVSVWLTIERWRDR